VPRAFKNSRAVTAITQAAARSVDGELAAVSRCAARLASAEGHLRSQAGLNMTRQEVRGGGGAAPTATATASRAAGLAASQGAGRGDTGGSGAGPAATTGAADEVGRQLRHQQMLLDGLMAKAARAAGLVEVNAARLAETKARLATDMRDKAQALSIDEAVLGVHSSGAADGCLPGPANVLGGGVAAPPGRAASEVGGPGGRRRWEGDAAALVAGAHQLVAESGR
jgi:hypothetical protein